MAGYVWRSVLTEEGRDHIKNHKYVSGKYTPLDNLLNPWWLWLTELLPRSLAPNMVTLMGFTPMVVSFILAWQYAPEFDTPPPRWLCFWTAFSLFLYQTFDAMDGKQARRIQASSPLGQLFDHGVDCLACMSHHSMASLIFMPGSSLLTMGGLAALQTGFFFAQWQEHYTGVLQTSFGVVGVTETAYGLMALAVYGGIVGPDGIKATMTTKLSSIYSVSRLEEKTVGEFLVIAWIGFCATLISISLFKTLTEAAKVKDKRVPGARLPPGQRRLRALLDLFPVIALNLSLFCWSESSVLRHPRLICFCIGLLFFFYTAQMIVHTMACMPFCYFQPSLIPYAAAVVYSHTRFVLDAFFQPPVYSVGDCVWLAEDPHGGTEATVIKLPKHQWTSIEFVDRTLGEVTVPSSSLQHCEEVFTFDAAILVFAIVVGLYILTWVLAIIMELKAHLGIYVLCVGKRPQNGTSTTDKAGNGTSTIDKVAPAHETTKTSSTSVVAAKATAKNPRTSSPGAPKAN